MSKNELKAAIDAQGLSYSKKSPHPIWKEVFAEYNRVNRQKLNINCGGCWSKVFEWLKS